MWTVASICIDPILSGLVIQHYLIVGFAYNLEEFIPLQSWSCMKQNDIEWYTMFNALDVEYDVEWFKMLMFLTI